MKNVLLVDFSNLAIRTLFIKDIVDKENQLYDWQSWKSIIFENLYIAFLKFKIDKVVLAIDKKNKNGYWRNLIYPQYKKTRKSNSEINWELFNHVKKEFLEEIKSNLPFCVIEINKVEGDDIIVTIVLNNSTNNFFILSTDNDYLQLVNDKTKLFNFKFEERCHISPETFIIINSLTGQKKDNIWNVKTPIDFSEDKRKPPLGEKTAEKIIANGLDLFLNENKQYKERYNLNRMLIDLKYVPSSLKSLILKEYNNYEFNNPENILPFIRKYGSVNMIEDQFSIEGRLLQSLIHSQ